MADWILGIVVVAGVALFAVYASRKGWVSFRGGRGIATLTVFHDFQPKDKQEAIEVVMEKKAGKKWNEQESGQK